MPDIQDINVTRGIYQKSLRKALAKAHMNRRHALGTVLQLHPVYPEFSHAQEILTSVQSVNWKNGEPLRLMIVSWESMYNGPTLRQLIPWQGKCGFLMADFRNAQNTVQQTFQMKVL
jgi:hypothetical protein